MGWQPWDVADNHTNVTFGYPESSVEYFELLQLKTKKCHLTGIPVRNPSPKYLEMTSQCVISMFFL